MSGILEVIHYTVKVWFIFIKEIICYNRKKIQQRKKGENSVYRLVMKKTIGRKTISFLLYPSLSIIYCQIAWENKANKIIQIQIEGLVKNNTYACITQNNWFWKYLPLTMGERAWFFSLDLIWALILISIGMYIFCEGFILELIYTIRYFKSF